MAARGLLDATRASPEIRVGSRAEQRQADDPCWRGRSRFARTCKEISMQRKQTMETKEAQVWGLQRLNRPAG